MMQYGFFDDPAGEYVITRPDTPQPWCNYIGSTDFGGVITNNASGYTFYQSAAQGRLSRFEFNLPPAMRPGRFIYLRDRENGDYWSNSWMPVGKPLEKFKNECRHGTGYTRIAAEYADIASAATYFIPLGATYEVWQIEVKNTGKNARKISVFPFAEPQCNWNVHDDVNNLQYNQYITLTRCDGDIINIASNVNMPEDPEHFTNKDQQRHTFFALSGARATAFDADLQSFLGAYGTYAAPRAVAEGKCGNATAAGDNPAAAFQVDLELQPGESKTFAVLYGVGRAETAGKEAAAAMATPEKTAAALDAVRKHWHTRLATLSAKTPDAAFNSMVNLWSPYNCLMTFYWSRAASLVYSGERDGLGYRDTAQDIVAASALITDESQARLELLLTGQHANGGAMPVVQPFNHHPGTHAAPAAADEPDYYRADDPLWLFNAVPAQVKESGNLNFYRKVLPFADAGEATVFGHLRRAIEFSLNRLGAHGLPCGLKADWNDCLVLGGKGESVFVAFQLRYALREYQDIAQRLGEPAEGAWAAEKLKTLDANLEKYAWDGEWYLRAYRYDGLKFGSRENTEGSIFMNAQTWAVISGHAAGARAEKVMDAVDKHLTTKHGVRLCFPPFTTTDPEVCRARVYNAGMKENAGIFNHTQGWGVIASALAGQRERAWQYLMNILPASFNEHAEIRQCEPYAVCQSTHSPESPRFGAGRLSWLSGSATWNYAAMTTAILGIRPDYDGLRIEPCVPAAWKGFTAVRRFRGAEYRIEVVNASGTAAAAPRITLDGKEISGTLIASQAAGVHEVKVSI